jgi:phage terminase small subunit
VSADKSIPPKDPLTVKQRLFFVEWQKDKNGTQAAIRAGYAPSNAASTASTLLALPKMKVEIQRWLGKKQAKVTKALDAEHDAWAFDRQRVIRQIAVGAFADVRVLVNSDGSPKGLHELTVEEAALVEGLDVLEKWETGPGGKKVFVGHVLKYRLARRQPWCDMLMRHLGEYKKDNEQATKPVTDALRDLLAGMRGSTIKPVADAPGDRG